MSKDSPATRAALIVLSREGAAPPILGKSLAERQLEFALAAGCNRIILLGDGAAAQAIALRHRAEAAKARVQVVSDTHGLAGSVRAEDELLVLHQDLLPESRLALDALGNGPAILALPAAAGVQAGFERIDLERASAGALIVPGSLLPRLTDLPEDSDPHGVLLRIALQHRLPEKRLPESVITDGSWVMVGPANDAGHLQENWLSRHLTAEPGSGLSRRIAHFALRRAGARLLALRHSFLAAIVGVLLILGGAAVAAWSGLSAVGFAAIALAAPLVEVAIGIARLKAAPFGSASRVRMLRLLLDGAILVAGFGAIVRAWPNRLFPPLVLIAALHAPEHSDSGHIGQALRDRFLIAGMIAIFAAFGRTEEGIMAAAIAILAANLTAIRRKRG